MGRFSAGILCWSSHVGVVPSHPCQLAAILRERRVGVEIVATDQHSTCPILQVCKHAHVMRLHLICAWGTSAIFREPGTDGCREDRAEESGHDHAWAGSAILWHVQSSLVK